MVLPGLPGLQVSGAGAGFDWVGLDRITVVTESRLLLLAGSPAALDTEARFTRRPGFLARTVIFTCFAAPFCNPKGPQRTVPLLFSQPREAEMNFTPLGRSSVTRTLPALLGPLFFTFKV
jgi:hypothetical protein